MEQAELKQIIERARVDRSTDLDLRNNELYILPESIGNLYGLTKLFLNQNQLISLPDNICTLTNLTTLVLSYNQLTSLPEDIGNLFRLKSLYLTQNQLASLPDSIKFLSNLTELYLSNNPWVDLSNLQSIPNLKRVYWDGANLSRGYWTHQSKWKFESLLDKENAGNIHTLIEHTKYEKLTLFSAERLQKKIVTYNSKFKLDLSNNQLTDLPESINSNLGYLTELILSNNQLTDLLKSISNLSNLTLLNLDNNKLTSLPKSISNLSNLTLLNLDNNKLTSLPKNIGDLSNLTMLTLRGNQLNTLPESISNLSNLTVLDLSGNKLYTLPESIGNLSNLTELGLNGNQLTSLPDSIGNITNLTELNLDNNQLTSLPENIENLTNLISLGLCNNKLTNLPESIGKLTNLTNLYLNNNPLVDFLILKELPNLRSVEFMGVNLPHRYWTKFCDWEPEWLLDEDNAEIKRILIEQVGYEKICAELNATTLDTWREYILLEIDGIQEVYDEFYESIDREPMVLLKMTCPSTAHIHILRVPPDMESAEAAITWINHGIHPDDFTVQT
jgi:leucine-rich repeat protein SHOC2